MKRIFLTTLILLGIFIQPALAKKDRKIIFNSSYNYEIAPVQVGVEGTKYVKVWGYGKKVTDAVNAAKRAAVAAAIFAGIPGQTNQIQATPALCSDFDAYKNNYTYFDDFFYNNVEFLRFVNLTSSDTPSGSNRLKVKGGYKVGISVQILHDNLRKKLEQDGIIKPLNYGF